MKHDPYLKDHRYSVFDIETTGLMPSKDMIISASFCDPRTGKTEQIFTDSPLLEKNTVSWILDRLSNLDAVITYNGRRFDLPFVLYRAKVHRLASALPLFWSIDLYQWLKAYWPAAGTMESLSQKSVEYALGLSESRTDPIGGGDCIPLYSRFLAIGDEKAKDAILLHNGDDVRQLAAICDSINFLPWHRIAFERGFSGLYGASRAILGPAKLEAGRISRKGKATPGKLPASFFCNGYALEYASDTGDLTLSIFPEKNGDLLFADLERYPVDVSSFADLAGFHDGFLVLAEEKEASFRECNRLSSAIVATLF